MAQQFYVIRRMPAPGSAAEKAMHARLERKGKAAPRPAGAVLEDNTPQTDSAPQPKQSRQRQQPKGKKRSKGSGGKPRPADRARSGDARHRTTADLSGPRAQTHGGADHRDRFGPPAQE